MMFPGRIAAVSYLNTVPLIYGIEHAGEGLRAALLLSPPSGCAEAFRARRADIALVPTGALPTLQDANIVTNFCIGAAGRVRTVVLVSDCAQDEIKRVLLDPHSVTSAKLARVLCRDYFRITPRFEPLTDYAMVGSPRKGDAFMLIGDKVFDYEGRFANTWDLAQCWEDLTGLPFVFAVWVARRTVPPPVLQALEKALEYGVGHIPEAISHYGHSGKPYATEYLTRNIDYRFDDRKRLALDTFSRLLTQQLP